MQVQETEKFTESGEKDEAVGGVGVDPSRGVLLPIVALCVTGDAELAEVVRDVPFLDRSRSASDQSGAGL